MEKPDSPILHRTFYHVREFFNHHLSFSPLFFSLTDPIFPTDGGFHYIFLNQQNVVFYHRQPPTTENQKILIVFFFHNGKRCFDLTGEIFPT